MWVMSAFMRSQIVHAQIIHSRFMPKDGIRFGIHYHSVEIKQDGRCFVVSILKTNIIFGRKGLNNHRTEQIFIIF